LEKKTAIHKDRHKLTVRLLYSLYTAFLLLWCFYGYKKPGYNWDIFPYMGVVLSHEQPGQPVHNQVYTTAKEQMPRAAYALLTDSTHPYRHKMATDPAEFTLQLPYYVVKPLYTRMAYLFYKAGVPLTRATVLPSLLAYFLLCLLIFHWLKQYLALWVAGLLGFLLAVWGPLLAASGLSTPDCLSALLLVSAVYCLVERRSLWLVYLFLLLSVFARIDNILPCFFILTLLVLTRKPEQRLSFKNYILMVSGAVLGYLYVCLDVKEFGWHFTFYPTFFRHMNTGYDMHASFSAAGYVALVKSQLMTGLYYSSIVLFAVLTVFYLYKPGLLKFNHLHLEQKLVLMFWMLIVLRFLLQPVMADRFYLPYYVCILVFLARKHLSVRRQT
jgi:hypothetical protein